MTGGRDSKVGIGLLFPDLLGTYGDSGNASILAERLRWRGVDAEVVVVRSGEVVPDSCQLYLVGGGEDLPQALAARQLGAGGDGGPFRRAVHSGAAVLAVCAGLQILGRSFVGPDGLASEGLGLIDCTSTRGSGPRAVGEIVVQTDAELGVGELTGYENHGGVTSLGPGAAALGTVRVGVGNGDGSSGDGARSGRVVGTYLHGPVLARNPALADLLLKWAIGDLAPLDDTEADELHRERLAAAASSRTVVGRWRRRRG